MTTYLYPELASKAAYKRALAEGAEITAAEHTPWGVKPMRQGVAAFSGPHYPKPHRYYGKAVVKNGRVVKIT